MNWNWEPNRWKKSTKVLLAIATVWPPIYMVLFLLTVFSFILLIPSGNPRVSRDAKEIDLIQLDRKIRNGEIKELTIAESDVIAVDRASNVEYHTYVASESTRAEIVSEAREQDANGRPRVDKIEKKENPPPPGTAWNRLRRTLCCSPDYNSFDNGSDALLHYSRRQEHAAG